MNGRPNEYNALLRQLRTLESKVAALEGERRTAAAAVRPARTTTSGGSAARPSGSSGGGGGGGISSTFTGTLDANARVEVRDAGAAVGTRRALNLIEGANVVLTLADDSANEAVDVTVATDGYTGSIPLAPLTGGGTPGSITVSDGIITAVTDPT